MRNVFKKVLLGLAITCVLLSVTTPATAMTKKDMEYSPTMTKSEIKEAANELKSEIFETIKHSKNEVIIQSHGYRFVPGKANNDGKLHFMVYNLTDDDLKLNIQHINLDDIKIPRYAFNVNINKIHHESAKELVITLQKNALKRYLKSKKLSNIKNIELVTHISDMYNKNHKITDTLYDDFSNYFMDYDDYRIFKKAIKEVIKKLKYEFDYYVTDVG